MDIYEKLEELNIEKKILKSIFNSSGIAAVIFNANNELLAANNDIQELLSFEFSESKKLNVNSFIYPDDLGKLKVMLSDLKAGKSNSYRLKIRFVRQTGDSFWGNLVSIAIRDSSGNIEYVISIIHDITEQRQTQIKLELKQRLLKSLVENISDCIYFKDINGYYIDTNLATAKKFGFNSSKDLVGKNDFDLIPEKQAQKSYNDEQEIIKSDTPKNKIVEKEILPDGKISYSSTTKMPLKDDEGRIVGTFGLTRDITEERNALMKLKYQAKLLDDIHAALVAVDNDYNITSWNKGAEIMYGVTAEEALGNEISEILKIKMSWAERKEIREQLIKDGHWRGETVHYDKNGNEIEVDWSANIVSDSEGKVIGNVSIIRDITKQKKMEEELRKSEARFRALYENATIGIYRSQPNGKLELANPALLRMLGYSSFEEFSKVDIEKDGYENISTRKSFLTMLDKDGELYGVENTFKKRDGSVINIRESAKIILDEKNNPKYIEGIVEDITERVLADKKIKQYNEDLKKLNASKDKFFSIIAHDLRSPFTALLGYSDMIVNDFDEMENDEIKQFATYINEEAKNVYGLLDNLLAWSRIQRGQFPFEPDYFIINNIVDKAINLFNDTAAKKGISLLTKLKEPLNVYADENSFFTALRNLISNAIKFTSDGGSISISAKSYEQGIEISVSDTGVGIKEEDIGKLFKSDAHHTTVGTSNEKGTGLGLLLCKELIEKNSGQISVCSKVGEGTTFSFTLPADKNSFSFSVD